MAKNRQADFHAQSRALATRAGWSCFASGLGLQLAGTCAAFAYLAAVTTNPDSLQLGQTITHMVQEYGLYLSGALALAGVTAGADTIRTVMRFRDTQQTNIHVFDLKNSRHLALGIYITAGGPGLYGLLFTPIAHLASLVVAGNGFYGSLSMSAIGVMLAATSSRLLYQGMAPIPKKTHQSPSLLARMRQKYFPPIH